MRLCDLCVSRLFASLERLKDTKFSDFKAWALYQETKSDGKLVLEGIVIKKGSVEAIGARIASLFGPKLRTALKGMRIAFLIYTCCFQSRWGVFDRSLMLRSRFGSYTAEIQCIYAMNLYHGRPAKHLKRLMKHKPLLIVNKL